MLENLEAMTDEYVGGERYNETWGWSWDWPEEPEEPEEM